MIFNNSRYSTITVIQHFQAEQKSVLSPGFVAIQIHFFFNSHGRIYRLSFILSKMINIPVNIRTFWRQ